MARCIVLMALAVFCAATDGAESGGKGTVDIERYFLELVRPDSPNHWLVAPAGFPGRPDAVSPVFAVSVARLRESFKNAVLGMPGIAVAGETAKGLHLVETTRVFRFRDDVRVQFIAIGPQQSTLALYSASRAGYWDFGTNRRRIEDWLARTAAAIGTR
jgi:uncharacterized protein (DUF1499 family)